LPTAFIRVALDFDELIDEFGSNHICGVAGTYVKELEQVCRLLGIRSVILGEQEQS
jgi:L-fucose isomerase-like protein